MSLIAWYKLDGNANDSVGTNNLTTNTATSTSTGGRIGGAYTFTSGNSISKTTGLTLYFDTTITAWGYSTSWASSPMLFSLNSDAWSGADLYFTSSTVCWNTGDGGANPFKISGVNVTQPSLNTWHHYCVLVSSSLNKVILYIDGAYYGEAIYKSPYQINKGFTIGNYIPGNTGYAWIGTIDDVRIYNHILSLKEIKELYKAKVLHYDFDDFQEPTTNIFPRAATALAFTGAYNGSSYGFGAGTNLQQVLDNTLNNSLKINPEVFITKVSRINSGVTQRDYVSIDLPSPLNSTRVVSFWYYGTYGSTIDPYNNDRCANLYYLNNSGAWQGGATSISIPVPTNQWKKITIKIVNKGSIAGTGWTWTPLHSGTNVSIANTEFWAFTMFQFENKDHSTPFTISSRPGKIQDISGYDNNVSLTEAITPEHVQAGRLGNGCYKFNGTTQEIIPSSTANFNYLSQITLSAWFQVTASAATYGTLIHKGTAASVTDLGTSFFLGFGSNGLTPRTCIGGDTVVVDISSPTAIAVGEWHHMAVTYNGTSVKLYVDGIEKNTSSSLTGNIYTSASVLTIGYRSTDNYPFNGYIDDVRVYSMALSASEIQELALNRAQIDLSGNFSTYIINEPVVVTDGLVGWWKMDGNLNDSSGNEFTLINSGATLTTDIFGNANKAYSFNGSSSYLYVPYKAALAPSISLTVTAWAYSSNWATGGKIISKTETGGYTISVSGTTTFAVYRNSAYAILTSAALSAGWHFFVGSYDGRYAKLYIDGSLAATDDAGGDYPITYSVNNALIIGAEAQSGSEPPTPTTPYFNGTIDDVRIYNKAISADDVLVLYKSALGLI